MTRSGILLTNEQLRDLRDGLERNLRKLERSLQTNGSGHSREIDQSCVGRLSRIEALQNQGFARSLRERERTQFDEVRQALGRLDAGTYGRCTSCRLQIGYERLVVFPETRTCAECLPGV